MQAAASQSNLVQKKKKPKPDQTKEEHGISLMITFAWYSLEGGFFTFH